jgi:probable phosphoglycerate mutase
MSHIYLIRHGDTDAVGNYLASWAPGVPINSQGVAEAERLAARLRTVPFAAIYASPLERAMMTAAPLAAALNLPIRECPAVGEFRFGEWTGRSLADLDRDPVWQRFNAFRSGTRAPGGEIVPEVQARMALALEEIRERHPDQTVAVFSHSDSIRAALLYYLGMPVDFIHRLRIETASVSIVRLEEWGAEVQRINDTGEWPPSRYNEDARSI